MKLPLRLFELIQDKFQTNICQDSAIKSRSETHVSEIEVKESLITTFKTHPQENLIVESNSTILAVRNPFPLPSQENSENFNELDEKENQQSGSINESSNSSEDKQKEVNLHNFWKDLILLMKQCMPSI